MLRWNGAPVDKSVLDLWRYKAISFRLSTEAHVLPKRKIFPGQSGRTIRPGPETNNPLIEMSSIRCRKVEKRPVLQGDDDSFQGKHVNLPTIPLSYRDRN